jgi:hypothetical protein
VAKSIEVVQEYRAKPPSVSCTQNSQCFGEGAHSTFIALLASARKWLTRRVKLQVVQAVLRILTEVLDE